MHGIEELMSILGYDKSHKIRERLDILRPVLEPYLKRGSKNKVLVDNNGLEILRRAKQLEDSGYILKDILKLLQDELKNNGAIGFGKQPESALITDLNLLLAEKDKQIDLLKSEVQFLRDRITYLENILQNRLPPTQEEIREKLAQKASRWERFRQLIKGE